ncbi:MAG: TatD family hydrolase [Bdellovibrionales bacterium]
MSFIDMHAHLERLEHSPEEALRLAQAENIQRVITIATEPNDLEPTLTLARKFYPKVFCTLGVHPHEGVLYTDEAEAFIRKNAVSPEVVALGEMGLDYYYEHSPREPQKQAFRRQLQVASELKLPVEIHTRDAEADTVEILKEFRGRVTGLIHCFTGTQWLAEQCLDLGYNISISGVVTFKNAEDLRKTVAFIPLDRLHVETDAPFLAPVPMRGKQNTPAFMIHTAKLVAQLKGLSLERLAEVTTQNAFRLMPKLV